MTLRKIYRISKSPVISIWCNIYSDFNQRAVAFPKAFARAGKVGSSSGFLTSLVLNRPPDSIDCRGVWS